MTTKKKTPMLRMDEPIEIHIDGCGARPDGKGSGFAWIQPRTGKSDLAWMDGLTNNQAEYRALHFALNALPPKSATDIFTDSQILAEQFNGRYAVRDAALAELLKEIRALIEEKSLAARVEWIPRAANRADKLLQKKGIPPTSGPGQGQSRLRR